MEPYDSDSSLEEEASGVSTNVLLGYATKESTDDTISQLGGEPLWLINSETPSAAFAQCKSCKEYMALLLQLNGDLPERFPGHERRLYIWACRRKACRRKDGSVRALRAVKIAQESAAMYTKSEELSAKALAPTEDAPKTKSDLGAMLFGAKPASGASKVNPFSTAPAPASSLAAKSPQKPTKDLESTDDLPTSFAEKARISASSQPSSIPSIESVPWSSISQFQSPYPKYFLDADYEYLAPTQIATNGSSSANMDIDMESDPSKANKDESTKEDSVLYEDTHDKTFQKFADTLGQNPEQVMRYEFGGQPLLYSRTDVVGALLSPPGTESSNGKVMISPNSSSRMPRCRACNSGRVFELQLTPHAIAELESDEDAAVLLNEGMEWGTVILGVCSRNCGGIAGGQTSYVEEWAGVQWEEQMPTKKG